MNDNIIPFDVKNAFAEADKYFPHQIQKFQYYDTKKCSKCGVEKSLMAFNKHKWCKECANKSSREWYYKNKEKAKQQHLNFIKNNPGYYETQEARLTQRQANKKWYTNNKEERNKQQMEYYFNNKTKFMEALHRRRARKAANGGRFTWEEFQTLCDKTGNKCLNCLAIEVKLTPDHVIPLAAGGSNDIKNIQPLCLSCNLSKGVKIIDYREGVYAN